MTSAPRGPRRPRSDRTRGARLLYLPPYAPDLAPRCQQRPPGSARSGAPIGQVFAILAALLRIAATRTVSLARPSARRSSPSHPSAARTTSPMPAMVGLSKNRFSNRSSTPVRLHCAEVARPFDTPLTSARGPGDGLFVARCRTDQAAPKFTHIHRPPLPGGRSLLHHHRSITIGVMAHLRLDLVRGQRSRRAREILHPAFRIVACRWLLRRSLVQQVFRVDPGGAPGRVLSCGGGQLGGGCREVQLRRRRCPWQGQGRVDPASRIRGGVCLRYAAPGDPPNSDARHERSGSGRSSAIVVTHVALISPQAWHYGVEPLSPGRRDPAPWHGAAGSPSSDASLPAFRTGLLPHLAIAATSRPASRSQVIARSRGHIE